MIPESCRGYVSQLHQHPPFVRSFRSFSCPISLTGRNITCNTAQFVLRNPDHHTSDQKDLIVCQLPAKDSAEGASTPASRLAYQESRIAPHQAVLKIKHLSSHKRLNLTSIPPLVRCHAGQAIPSLSKPPSSNLRHESIYSASLLNVRNSLGKFCSSQAPVTWRISQATRDRIHQPQKLQASGVGARVVASAYWVGVWGK
jgi:hypothetical protein